MALTAISQENKKLEVSLLAIRNILESKNVHNIQQEDML